MQYSTRPASPTSWGGLRLKSVNLTVPLNDVIAIPGTFFGGTATVSCNQPVAMIGLHFELRDGKTITFSTLPPAILSTTPADTGDHPWSRPNIERFRGTWQFTYTVLSS